jgi:hypothetical protein
MFGGNGNSSVPNPGALITINQTTGISTLVGTPAGAGGLSGLAFNASGDLYGSSSGGRGSTSSLIRIDPATGASLGAVNIHVITGNISIGDLSFRSGTNVLYGMRSQADNLGKPAYCTRSTRPAVWPLS